MPDLPARTEPGRGPDRLTTAVRPLTWLARHDRDLVALRRAGRAAIVMPAMFALGDKVIGNPTIATFAAFGSFAMLLLVDFPGPVRERVRSTASLALAGAALVCLGTLASREAWLAAVGMGVVALAVLFAGVVSSVLASATSALLLAFILSVSLPAPVESIPDRLAGWAMAAGAALLAVAVAWPAPARDPLRGTAVAACRALARRLATEAAYLRGGEAAPSRDERDQEAVQATEAVQALRKGFLATPYRPTGLSTQARTVVRLVDELSWLNSIVTHRPAKRIERTDLTRAACAVRGVAANVLDRGADLLETPSGDPGPLREATDDLTDALDELERTATVNLPVRRAEVDGAARGGGDQATEFVSSLDPSFRAQEMSFAVTSIARNVDLAAAAERRTWLQHLLGRQPGGLAGTWAAARERAGAHAERHSVWLHNSVRGAVGLALAVLVASLTGVQHSFWVVLGTLSVLRSNALSTGQNVVRGVVGTAVGVVIGAGLLWVVGTDQTVLWFLLPVAVLVAGFAPAAISFTAGQAAFTLTLVILYNIIRPDGWRVGLLRVEDIAIGCAISLGVGLLFWPRGAAAALNRALAEAYEDTARYLQGAVRFGVQRCDPRAAALAPVTEAQRAAAAARRLDDTFRTYLAERGAKPVPLAGVTTLVTGVVGLRLASDAVLELWRRDDGSAAGDRSTARDEVLAACELVRGWYDDLAATLAGHTNGAGPAPRPPLPHDVVADGRLVEAVRRDLADEGGRATATAVRMIWTADHLDAARRLQESLAGPARTAAGEPDAAG